MLALGADTRSGSLAIGYYEGSFCYRRPQIARSFLAIDYNQYTTAKRTPQNQLVLSHVVDV